MWVLPHVVAIASGSSIIVKIIVAIVLVERLVAESSIIFLIIIVEWAIVEMIVILKRLEYVRVILSEGVFILHADSRSPDGR
jgi:hypothetical protein